MSNSFLWKIGGEAGFGIMTIGFEFAKICAHYGFSVADYAEYPSLIRGGHNTYEVHFGEADAEKIRSSKYELDILVCLNKATFELHKKRLTDKSIIIYDPQMFTPDHKNSSLKSRFFAVPMLQTLREEKASMFMINTYAMGASLASLGWPIDDYFAMLEHTFGDKGPEVVAINKNIAEKGFEYVKTMYSKDITPVPMPRNPLQSQLVMTGNDAFSLGAVVGDCRLYSAYPMTPSSTVLSILAGWAKKTGMVVRHAEDEISVINTALGSSFAGVRSAVGTSGGGFALMVESVSFAGIAEIPIVIFVSQRPGPATGMPTSTEQGDLQFVVHAGHGEFPKIVLAPGDIVEMYELTAEAFNLADMYQTPVFILSDKHLSESHWSISKVQFNLFARSYSVDRGKIVAHISGDNSSRKNYERYSLSADGISPMLIPGQKGLFYQANSYEHLPDGHTTEGSKERIAQVKKRLKKSETFLKNDWKKPHIYGDLQSADVIIVSWGSSKGAILDAITQKNTRYAFIHFIYLFPLDIKKIQTLFEHDAKYLFVENNSQSQFYRLLKEQGVIIKNEDFLLKFDGRQIFKEEIEEKLHKMSRTRLRVLHVKKIKNNK